ncbi:spermidine synthase [Emcibacter sp.]|uniref:spermidine synthase n=1 Tax=Emcibacter sp. TaxID=1979954 RepID=UPI003A911CD6
MSRMFQELAFANTPLGELSLRRRRELTLNIDVYEIKLNDEFLMSSLFVAAEEELARLGLAGLKEPELDVVVGGLGLGYTAVAALDHPDLRNLLVVDALEEVINWHKEKILPLGEALSEDPRCRFVHGDFFAMVQSAGFDRDAPGRRYHAILLDIDHSPRFTLNPSHNSFYTPEGLKRLNGFLLPGGVFALWSNDPPDEEFGQLLKSVFTDVQSHIVTFENPLRGGESANTVYVARAAG